ncbi:ly6/PLAUR domain-containing protein 2-like [Macrosteles quadrilineatus]|uniref:ly6/PLAUR domain-containing protein 2-like n=1 Tax=Macrosteles quadrilineatus TaxID=74068 RepID=UPI0023E09D5B|nr:ly6/PLAUR domain-containing protein 2-like [Macrosteles quadrilineatus]XP_054268837.1 ly6/PLAUR domain-containing protein 2-like [Macrosteles quadrilineatus]
MTVLLHSALGAVLVLLAFVQTGEAIKCYECNSYNDTRCAMEKPPVELEKDCVTKDTEKIKHTMCRKIVQTIEFEVNGLQPDSRVIRSCGWDESSYKGRCYQRSGFGGRQEVCSCTSDLCNAAGAPSSALAAIVASLGLALASYTL